MNIRHELFPQDPARRLAFCTWLVERYAHFWPNLVIGDEASFQMNARVIAKCSGIRITRIPTNES